MKTRIIYPKNLWFDKKFSKLSEGAKNLCVWLITNENVGLTRIYEQKEMETCFVLGFSDEKLEKCKLELSSNKLFFFVEEWVFINNNFSYCDYSGRDRVMKSKDDEISKIPNSVIEHFNRLLSGELLVANPLKVPKAKEKGGFHDYNEEEVNNDVCIGIAEMYSVSIQDVNGKKEELKLYCASKGTRYKDYKATLQAWVRRAVNEGKIKKVIKTQDNFDLPLLTSEQRERGSKKLDEIRNTVIKKIKI